MKLTTRDRALLGVIVVVLLCGGFYKFLLTPERNKATHLQSQVTAARVALGKAQQQVLAGRQAAAGEQRAQTELTAVNRAVPKVANVPALLKLLWRTANAAHVSMQSITLSGSSASSATTATTPAPAATSGATTIPISLAFDGGYQALNRLVDRLDGLVTVSHQHLQASGPLVGISSVSVSPSATTTSASGLSIQLTATIYQRSTASTGA